MVKFKILKFCNKVAKMYLCKNGGKKVITQSQLGCAWHQCIAGLRYSLRITSFVPHIFALVWNKYYRKPAGAEDVGGGKVSSEW